MSEREEATPEDAQRYIRQHLEAVAQLMREMPRPTGYAFHSIDEWLLKHGRFWTPQPLPKRYRRGIPKWCFGNAQRLALHSKTLRYVEGYAMSVIPIHHAWCVDANDRVIDVTWDHIAPAYFGVVFDRDAIRQFRRESRSNLSILHDYERDYPLLKDNSGHP